ncbi:MAG: dihydroneopterin aldolase [Deltaproteobacteria bacterium]|jgi:dihydroneopterin aldolase|nr:dihydroneopterin aldolase [Deltaproteobacteria bacterium]
MINQIEIKQIEIDAMVGCLPQEKGKSSRIIIDINLQTELFFGTDTKMDHLARTIDYRKITQEIKEVVRERHFNMLESLAENCATRLFALDQTIKSAQVVITKPAAKIGGGVPEVSAIVSHQ